MGALREEYHKKAGSGGPRRAYRCRHGKGVVDRLQLPGSYWQLEQVGAYEAV
jgi:hypothetical protein